MRERWTAEKRAECIGALWASAQEVGGDWMPHYALVSAHQGVPTPTLIRWWQGRDRARDGAARSAATRARDAHLVAGADAWTTGMIDKLRRLMDLNLTTDRIEAADVDAAARAIKGTAETVNTLRALADPPADPGDLGGDPAVVEVRVRGALARIRTG